MASDVSGIGRRMAAGAAWMVSMRVAIRFIGLFSTVILARLLVPADFGLVAMAMLFFGFIEIFGQFGFDTVLIREKLAGRDYYDTAWTLSIIRGTVTAAILSAGAGLIAGVFEDHRLIEILYVLAGTAFVQGFVNIGIVDFRKDLNFARDFLFLVSVKLVSFAVTISLAWILQSYWALVIGIASGGLAQLLLGFVMHSYRPRPSLARWREIMRFSKWLMVTNVLGFVRTRSDTAIVGKLGGAGVLGIYSVAYEIATLATTELVAPIRRAIFPGYALLADSPAELKKAYLDGLALIFILALPVAAGIGAVSDSIVNVFLGAKWREAIALIQILTVCGIFQICTANTVPLFNALGRPELNTAVNLIGVAVGLPLLYVAATGWGAQGIAIAISATSAVTMCLYMGMAARLLRISLGHILAVIWRTLLAAAGMTLAVYTVSDNWPVVSAVPMLALRLACEVAIGALSYTVLSLGLWQMAGRPLGPESHILSVIISKARLSHAGT